MTAMSASGGKVAVPVIGAGNPVYEDTRRKVVAAREARLAALVTALRAIIEANNDFRKGMPDDWDGDPLQDAIDSAAKKLLEQSR